MKPISEKPRQGWDETFKEAETSDNGLLDPETTTEWDKEEWEW